MTIEPYKWLEIHPGETVIGVDEVGRGCLAGPVYAAASIIDTTKDYKHFTDSKALTEARREILAEEIKTNHRYGIGFASVEEISEINILQASFLAMKRAILELGVRSGTVLVDGKQRIPGLSDKFKQIPLVKGDFRAEPIGAASIVAKVTRDNLIKELGVKYPNYEFAKHKGYATKIHKAAISKYGPCPIHRPTFAGVKEFL